MAGKGLGPSPHRSDMRQLFLNSELPLLQELDSRWIRHGSAQFFPDLPFKTRVLEL